MAEKKGFGTRMKSMFGFMKEVFSNFIDDKVMKFSAALSYYTIFSIAPILIIMISVAGAIFGKKAAQGQIYGQINGLVGSDAAAQIQEMIGNTHTSGKTFVASVISIVALVFGATGVFAEIQDSINSIWGLKSKPTSGILKVLLNRLISFSLVISLGFVAMVTLMLNTVVDVLSKSLSKFIPGDDTLFVQIFNYILIFVVITGMFAVIFKVLPDAKIKWKDVMRGAVITAILFIIGKFVITIYVTQSKLGSVYGAAGSIVVLLVWVYYTAVILYFGAEFTKVYAIRYGGRILPNDYAVWVKVNEEEQPNQELAEVHARDESESKNS
ncbi:MAG: YihY/virulence factor BrkB family protein [Chitinophagaceae bacterium]